MSGRQQLGRSFGGRGRGFHHRGGRGRGGRGGRHNSNNVRRNNGSNFNGGRGGRQGPRRPMDVSGTVVEEIGVPLVDDSEEHTSSSNKNVVSIAIEGCCHGELDAIYQRLQQHEESRTNKKKIDLLICCGDFQSLRTLADFHSLAVPPKYRNMGSFYDYYALRKVAPILTLFVGGNHEASQPLQELCYGGWVAPNIYYMGAASVVRFRGLCIGGVSGIYKAHDYEKGCFELPPYDRSTLRSVYHTRIVDVFRLQSYAATVAAAAAARKKATKDAATTALDVMVSHDWPRGVEQHGDTQSLIRRKPFFRDEISRNDLGSPSNEQLLNSLRPEWWFAAHLHVKFFATIVHNQNDNENDGKGNSREMEQEDVLVPTQTIQAKKVYIGSQEANKKSEIPLETATSFVAAPSESAFCNNVNDLTEQMTRFLSLDKCLPRRHFLSVLNIEVPASDSDDGLPSGGGGDDTDCLEYSAEWLAVLKKTHQLTRTTAGRVTVPQDHITCTDEEVAWVRNRLGNDLKIRPDMFQMTVAPQQPNTGEDPVRIPHPLPPPYPRMGNPITDKLLEVLELDHITTIPYVEGATRENADAKFAKDDNEIDLDDDDDNEVDGNEIALDIDSDTNDISSKKPKLEPS